QVSVTFQVDMNGESVSPNGVHVAGNWQSEANGDDAEDWQAGDNMMSDSDADGIYELTVNIPAGEYQYKFINDNAWGNDEAVPSEIANGGNRFFAVSAWHGNTDNLPDGYMLPAVVYGGTAPAGQIAVRLNISMANETVDPSGVHVAGDVITPNWTPEYGTCSSTGPDQYGYVTYVNAPGSYQYKFINGDNWGLPNESAPAECGDGTGNRVVEVVAETVITPAYCYNLCEPCSEPNVSLTVDLSTVAVDNGGYIAGDFTGWGDGVPMNDNGDGTYTYNGLFPEGVHQFKFLNGPGGYEDAIVGDFVCTNDGGNRFFEVVGDDAVSLTACYGQCGETCVTADPANITFQVDMSQQTVSPDGVWLIGGFTNFQANAVQLSDDDADGVYTSDPIFLEGSPFIAYKFVNGDVNVPANEESADFLMMGCGLPNGIGGWNRIHTRSGVDEVLQAVGFNSCTILSAQTIELGEVAIFPNPSTDVAFLDVENPNGHTLRMNVVDITGKVVVANTVITSTRTEINTSNLPAGLYFLDVVNERNERGVYKLMVK
ncbi:MAG: T9SS type A sorting domain-containing protein, partial [Bacteroidota bacterium]